MDVYLACCRPLLAGDPQGFLFPARKGAAKTPGSLADQIKRTLRQGTGIGLNAHAFRHLSPLLLLREHPGEYETTRLLLGHEDLNTNAQYYCGLKQADASQRRSDRPLSQEGARMIRQPPVAGWPARDRELWYKAIEPSGLFGGGAGAHWSAATRVFIACGYNCRLSWLASKGLLDSEMRPAGRVTRERVASYIAEIQTELAPYSVLARIQGLHDALRVMAPESNWKRLRQLRCSLKTRARPARDKLSRVKAPQELIALGSG
jgi:hypothetical protein